jgi:hypothetical protein
MATLKALKERRIDSRRSSKQKGQPLFKVRSGLRELKNAGFAEEAADKYVLSKNGTAGIQ